MKFAIKGSLEIRIPDDVEYTVEAEDKAEAIEKLIEKIIEDGEISAYSNSSYLRIKAVTKIFKVVVKQTFENTVYVSTDDYPDIECEEDAAMYVENNIEDFEDSTEYDGYTERSIEATCRKCDTEEEEVDYYE